MPSFTQLALACAGLHLATSLPAPISLDTRQTDCPNQVLGGLSTLTAYAEGNSFINGLKLQLEGGLYIGVPQVASYCPTVVQDCPNGTDTVFFGLQPDSEVPGGQQDYVDTDGAFMVTVQHEASIPPNAYPTYIGWQYTAFTECTDWCEYESNCPQDDPRYDCEPPLGYYSFQFPNSTLSGVFACPAPGNSPSANGSVVGHAVYANVPGFNSTGCTALTGLGAHNYTGVSPPVWSYY